MNTLLQDLRFAARLWVRNPGFTLLVVLVLAIGIGANAAIFSLADSVLLKPLPFVKPGELMMLWEHAPGYEHNRVAPLNFLDWSEQNRVFSSMAAVAGSARTIILNGVPERIDSQSVSPCFFDLLGIRPLAGRAFAAADGSGGARVVMMSERLWKSTFAASPQIIGGTIQLDAQPFTVIGIVPSDFQLFYKSDLWTPFVPNRSPELRREHYLQVVGRIKPGVSLGEAQAGMGLVADDIARISPETNKGWGVTIEPLKQALIGGDLRLTSFVLAGVVGLVLLLACANLANLLLSRGAVRSREIAIRTSLGGSPARIVRQLLTENLLLALIGGTSGVLLAWLAISAAPLLLPADLLPVAIRLEMNTRVLAFSAFLTLLTGLAFGLFPAWNSVSRPVGESLKSGSYTSTATTNAFRGILAVVQIAIAVLLASGAALLLRTLGSLNNVDPGFKAPNVLTANISLPMNRYKTEQNILTFFRGAEQRIRSTPGIVDVAFGTSLPLNGMDIGQGFEIAGESNHDTANQPTANYQMISPDYFKVLGIPILKGRAFDARDNEKGEQVCIVNEELVRRYLNGRDPLTVTLNVDGMSMEGPKPVARRIVGVVRQVKVNGLGEKQPTLEVYVPVEQNSWYWSALAVRTAGDTAAFIPGLRTAIAGVDGNLAVAQVRTMDEVAAESISQPRFRARLVGIFAALALFLASIGIFGVLALSVSQRTREFGIRMALGAGSGDVLSLVLKSGLKITAAGLLIGIASAAILTRFLASLLFAVKPLDPLSFIASCAVLVAVVAAACVAPAARAVRVDPMKALRQD